MFSPRLSDSHVGQDYCVGTVGNVCVSDTCRRERGEVTVTAGAKCPCPVGQMGARGAEL